MFDHRLVLLVVLSGPVALAHLFSDDDWKSFDAFGVKIATNDLVVVQARNRERRFLIQFGPSAACPTDYLGNAVGDQNFLYSVAVPKYDLDQASIVFIGENDDRSSSPHPFVGHLRLNASCHVFAQHIHHFPGQSHEEFYVLGVDPFGAIAYGFASRFAFTYDLQSHAIANLPPWPKSNFTPRAVDVSSEGVAIVAGLYPSSPTSWKALIYMLAMGASSFSVVDTWEYEPATSSWQATASSIDAGHFTTKHLISVSIYSNTSQLLVGMPSMNVVLWFDMSTNLSLQASRENGDQRGYGQTVAWSDESAGPYPVVLGNAYAFPYTWSSSIIYWFTPAEFSSSNPIMPLFPTIQYPRWIELTPQLLSIAMATLNVVLLDSSGQIYVIVAAPMGFYPDTSVALGSNPAFSVSVPCPAGTYNDWVGIYICFLCPMGTMSDEEGSEGCSPYTCGETPNDFCPLGSISNDTYADLNVLVATPTNYPESPETTNIDDILIINMFTFGDSTRCLLISPLFWVMMMALLATLIGIFMGILKFFRQYAHLRHTLKRIFRQADLIREGEVWMAGLASFALLVLLIFSYVFSTAFLHQYPIETASDFTFACDTTLRNAQFDTSLQSASATVADDEKPIFALLDNQQLNLTIDFINTRQQCDEVSVSVFVHLKPKKLPFNCTYARSLLSVSLLLDSRSANLIYDFAAARSIGGFRLTLTGERAATKNEMATFFYDVRELLFSQPFLSNEHTLAYDPSIELQLTRIINKTQPLNEQSPAYYSTIWAATASASTSKLFLTFDEYLYYGLLKTSFAISISERSYYVMNSQTPITKQAELIFHNLLFTTVCMELFGLGYLAIKLFLVPIFHHFRLFIEKRSNIVHPAPSPEPAAPLPVEETRAEKSPPAELFLAKCHEKPVQRPRKKKTFSTPAKQWKR